MPADLELAPSAQWRIAGHPAVAQGALTVVLGSKRFRSDLTHPGMLHGAVLRPPVYGARLRSVDTRHAGAMAGITV